MNKQELIDYCNVLKESKSRFINCIDVDIIIDTIKQLDEPEKVKVPQFVDDVIEGAREYSPELEDALHYACSNGSQEFTEWYQKKSNRDLFARAWLDGYEVEKEKRYIVKIKNLDSDVRVLKKRNRWYFGGDWGDSRDTELKIHTRKQLEEADFGWVFDCPGIEVEEVEG